MLTLIIDDDHQVNLYLFYLTQLIEEKSEGIQESDSRVMDIGSFDTK